MVKISYNYLDENVKYKTGGEFLSYAEIIGKLLKDIISGKKSSNEIISYREEDNAVTLTCCTKKCGAKIDFLISQENVEFEYNYMCPYCNVQLLKTCNGLKLIPNKVNKLPDVNISIMGNTLLVINDLISNYRALIQDFNFVKTEDTIELYIQENVGAEQLRLIKIIFLHSELQVQIPNILIGKNLKNKGIGKNIISQLFAICQHYNYNLFIVDMVESFMERMLKRGAIQIDCDSVQITTGTDLGHKYVNM